MSNLSSNQPGKATQSALQALDSIPRCENEPVFNAPWEAEVFALSLVLYEQGLFTWQEWADTLSSTIHTARTKGDPDLGDTYYLHWLSALERMVIDKKVGDPEQLQALYAQWDKAAQNTAHGQPVELS